MTLQQALAQARHHRDAEHLLVCVLQKNRAFLHTFPEYELTAEQTQQWQNLLARLQQGEPLAYLLGTAPFYHLDFIVDKNVLIPRLATECLVEQTLMYCKLPRARILELGTGSGAIACALAHERPEWNIVAIDNSEAALTIAKQNQQRHQLHNLTLLKSDWFSALSEQTFDVIVSNPPYIDETDPAVEASVRTHEPHTALFAHDHGLAALQHIITHARKQLTQNGLLILEHGYQQQDAVCRLLTSHGFSILVQGTDQQDLPRFIVAQ